MDYINDRGELEWERIVTILSDTNDGYLSNLEDVSYRTESGGGLLSILEGDCGDDVDPDKVGSRLLKSISRLHSIAIDHTISGEPEDETLYRMAKFAPLVAKLSDEYAMKNQRYSKHFHDDVVSICDAIAEAKRNQ